MSVDAVVAASIVTPCPDDGIYKLVPTRSDKDIAEDLKRRFVEALKPVLDLANEAAASEFMTSLSFERDPYGRSILVARLSKHF